MVSLENKYMDMTINGERIYFVPRDIMPNYITYFGEFKKDGKIVDINNIVLKERFCSSDDMLSLYSNLIYGDILYEKKSYLTEMLQKQNSVSKIETPNGILKKKLTIQSKIPND